MHRDQKNIKGTDSNEEITSSGTGVTNRQHRAQLICVRYQSNEDFVLLRCDTSLLGNR